MEKSPQVTWSRSGTAARRSPLHLLGNVGSSLETDDFSMGNAFTAATFLHILTCPGGGVIYLKDFDFQLNHLPRQWHPPGTPSNHTTAAASPPHQERPPPRHRLTTPQSQPSFPPSSPPLPSRLQHLHHPHPSLLRIPPQSQLHRLQSSTPQNLDPQNRPIPSLSLQHDNLLPPHPSSPHKLPPRDPAGIDSNESAIRKENEARIQLTTHTKRTERPPTTAGLGGQKATPPPTRYRTPARRSLPPHTAESPPPLALPRIADRNTSPAA